MAAKFKACAVPGCNGNAGAAGAARGWCGKHYQRWQRSGDPEHVDIDRGAPMRFIDTLAIQHDGSECLIWPFTRDPKGYGQVWHEGSLRGAHRIVCLKVHGEPPSPDHQAAHSCGKGHEGCVSGGHLRWDTRVGNFADKAAHGTLLFGEAHGSAKITDDDVRAIRGLLGTMMQKDIAALYGISKATMSAIATGKRWGHVK